MTHRFLLVHQMDKVKVAAAIARAATAHARVRAHQARRRPARRAAQRARASTPPPSTATSARRQREQALADFSAGKLPVLVATDVAARGIHVDDIDVVVHYDPPEDHKAYLHRSGRTARAGEAGVVVTLVLWDQELEVRLQKRLGLSSRSWRCSPTTPAWPTSRAGSRFPKTASAPFRSPAVTAYGAYSRGLCGVSRHNSARSRASGRWPVAAGSADDLAAEVSDARPP